MNQKDQEIDWESIARNVKGVREETTTGASTISNAVRGKTFSQRSTQNDSVTKSKFDNLYG